MIREMPNRLDLANGPGSAEQLSQCVYSECVDPHMCGLGCPSLLMENPLSFQMPYSLLPFLRTSLSCLSFSKSSLALRLHARISPLLVEGACPS